MGPLALDWKQSTDALSRSDPILGGILRGLGSERLQSRGEPFTCLVRSIVGQQISVKAADAVWTRLTLLVGKPAECPLEPADLLRCAERLRDAGLSTRKVAYVLSLAEWFEREPDLERRLYALPDEAVIQLLTQQPGIGPWTAQMFLIFTLMRPDVFPADDLGVLKAIDLLYPGALSAGISTPTPRLRRQEALAFSQRWAPHRTVATWLLWRSLDPIAVSY